MCVPLWTLKRCLLACVVFAAVMYVWFPKQWWISTMIVIQELAPVTIRPVLDQSQIMPKPDQRGFLVDTPACRIPDFDPYDQSVLDLIKPKRGIFCGDHLPSITYEDGNMLRINWTVVHKFHNGNLGKCQYWPLIRRNNSDSESTNGKAMNLTVDAQINDEFIKVECTNSSNVLFYRNFHTFISLKNETEIQCEENFLKHMQNDKPQEVLDVLMLGVDSVSRLNFIRQMPRTRKYLLEKMGAVEMTGHTKVADNTFPNMVPILSGKFPHELPWGADHKQKFDNFSFIWKDFIKNGFRTSYIEDAPNIDLFHYMKKGFVTPPTHFYNRVVSTAMEKERGLWKGGRSCFRDRLEGEIVLKQTRDFIILQKNKPHFALTFITRQTHDDLNNAGSVDDLHLQNLRKIYEGGLLNNTMLIFFSDHGCRFGPLRRTFVGKMEERLPVCLLAFPAWFRDKYPDITKNIQTNAGRLTSHFDLYETMQDVLHFTGKAKKGNVSARGISLLREIPRDRSCDQAGILPHWCVCLNTYTVDKFSDLVQKSALQVVNHINFLLHRYKDRCERLTLSDVHNPVKMGANRAVIDHLGQTNVTTDLVQLTVVTKPGLAMFESTVSYDNSLQVYSVVGDISRINKYGNQSHCIDKFHLKKFCFCK